MEEQMNQIEIPNRPLSGNQQLNWQEIRIFRFWCLLQKNFAWGLFFILPFSVLISGDYMATAKTHVHHLFAFLLHGASIGLIFEYAMTIIRTVLWDVRDMRESRYTEETIADLEMLYEGRTSLCLDADDWESARWIRGRNGYVLKLRERFRDLLNSGNCSIGFIRRSLTKRRQVKFRNLSIRSIAEMRKAGGKESIGCKPSLR